MGLRRDNGMGAPLGIPQSDTQNTRLYFVELHGFF